MKQPKLSCFAFLYALATVQFVWCYLWLVRPYVSTLAYEHGRERMPFQGRLLMVPVMRWAHEQSWIARIAAMMHRNIYWFPRSMEPEALVQAAINVVCLVIAGTVATKIYRAASRWHVITPIIYPIVLILCVGTYVLHTIQNFRFIYDLPSLAFFSAALWIIYFRKPKWMFVLLFLIATVNRETTLLLLPVYALSETVKGGHKDWSRLWATKTLAVLLPLGLFWLAWQFEVRRIFAGNVSEFYPRISQNVEFLFSPRAWPQMLGACCYLLPVILVSHRHLRDAQLRAWLWALPIWFGFMFVYGILIETRIFGELIPYVACTAALIAEESIAVRLRAPFLHRPHESTVIHLRTEALTDTSPATLEEAA